VPVAASEVKSMVTNCGISAPGIFVNGQVAVPVFGQVKVPALRGFSGCGRGGSGVVSGVAHAVGLAGGYDDGGVMEKAVQDADGGGVFG
jgi:hypothetical protein